MKRASMRARMYLSYLAISLGIVLAFSAVFYLYTSRILVAEEQGRLQALTGSLCEQTEGALKEMDGVSVDLVYINRQQKELENTLNLARQSDVQGEQWQRHQALSALASLFVAVNGTGIPVHQLNLYDMEGNRVGIGANSAFQSGLELARESWYAETMAADGHKHITMPYQSAALSANSGGQQYYVSLLRLFSGRDRECAGIIETVQRCSVVFRNALALSRSGEQVYILDAQGALLFPYPATEQGKRQAQALRQGGGAPFLAHSLDSGYTGWTYIVARSQSAVLRPVYGLLRLILLIAAALLLPILLFAHFTSRRMTRPLSALGARMRTTDAATLTGGDPTPRAGYREIDELADSFEQMRSQLGTSMNQRIQAEQQALKSRNLAMQAQINPHFFYNTLSSIIALADAGRAEDVVSMCRSMTGMMRYVTGSDATATLREELDYIKQYLYCMKIRYENSFCYTIDVPDGLLGQRVPRLIIQPFVENALKYGIDCAPPWRLTIAGEGAPGRWRIFVEDSGPGFSDKVLGALREQMRTIDQSVAMPDIHVGGMGILNVYARWKLFAGEGALFEIGTKSGGGYAMIGRESGG